MSIVRSLIIIAIVCFAFVSSNAQLAYVTFLHNSPDVGLKTIDLYLTQQGVTTVLEDIDFQESRILEGIFGDLPLNIKVAPGTSTGIGAAVASHDFTPKSDSGYMSIVSGVITPAQYAPNPNTRPTAIAITSFLTVLNIADPSKTGFYSVHGSTDLETFDVYFRGNATPIASSLSYGDRTQSPISVARTEVTVDVTKAGDKTKVLGSFALNIPALSSEVVVLVVSGFKTPGDNNGSTDSLALLAILENGLVVRAPLIAGSQTARVQVVNNLPEIQFTSVDVWLKSDAVGVATKKIDNLAFRGATGFTEFPSGSPLVIGIALATSALYKDTIFTDTIDALRPGRTYSFILTGLVGSGFKVNPDSIDSSAHVAVLENALEAPTLLGQLAVRAGNFATDAGPLTIFGKEQYVADASYLEAAPEYVHLAPVRDTFWVRDEKTGSRIKGYVCTACEQSRALLVISSGFLDPASNNAGPAFKLIFIQSNGTVISNATEVDTTGEPTNAVADEGALTYGSSVVRSYPNPTYGGVTVAWGGAAQDADAKVQIYDVQGNLLLSALVPSGVQRVELPTAAFPAGVHIARVSRANGSIIGTTSFSLLK